MLEQNTDRIWVIMGSILFGASVIALINMFYPEVFSALSESMSSTLFKLSDIDLIV